MTKRLGAALALLGFWLVGASPTAALTLQATDDASTSPNQPGAKFGSNTSVVVRNVGSGGARSAVTHGSASRQEVAQ